MSNLDDRLTGLSLEEKRALLAQKLREKAAEKRTLPLSYSQRRIWLVEQMTPGNSGLNIPLTVRIRGSLNLALLEQSINFVINRHETLRTAFSSEDGEPVQIIHPTVNFSIHVEDVSQAAEPEVEANRRMAIDAVQPFDISQAPLLRVKVAILGDGDYIFHVVLHHLVADGWSLGVFIREMGQVYTHLIRQQTPELPTLSWQYADFVRWQRENLQGELVQKQLAYWKDRLEDSPSLLPLPTDHPRPRMQTYSGGHLTLTLSPELSLALRNLSRREGVTLFMTLLAGYNVLLSRFTGLKDIPVGSPIAGRNRAETEGLIGVFINNIVIRTRFEDSPSFQELLQRVRTAALSAYEHQDIPFEMLLEELHPKRNLNHTPLFQVFFNMLNFRVAQFNLPGVEAEVSPAHDIGSNFDMTLYGVEREEVIEFLLVYNADLYTRERMQCALDQYQYLLEQIVENPHLPIDRYSLAVPQHALPDMSLPLEPVWDDNVLVHFYQNVVRRPHQIAVVDSQGAWTYEELNDRTNQLAHYLRLNGISSGSTVAIYAHRSASLIWAMLGIVKAGAAFLILDPDYPAARLCSYLDLARPEGFIQLTSARPLPEMVKDTLSELQPRCWLELPPHFADSEAYPFADQPTQNLDTEITPDTLAYIAFTSGSTGKPKGIVGTWGPLSHFLAWHVTEFGFTEEDRFSLFAGLSHDPLLRDVFTPLWLGATLCIPDPEYTLSPEWVTSWMKEQRITVSHLTPAMSQIISSVEGKTVPTLRYAFFGGDLLSTLHIKQLRTVAPAVTCVNFYGATETPQAMGYYVIPEIHSDVAEAVSIGQGIDGVQLLVLRPDGELAGVSEVGEIYVRTPYLTLGYLNDQSLTNERYVINPVTGKETDKLYRTGDLGRFNPDGTVAYLGRKDQQVKIRGFRIELAEIEAEIAQHAAVRQFVITVEENEESGEKSLALYVVLNGKVETTSDDLRKFLGQRLPSYMIPSKIVILDAIPLTPNGKLDRQALSLIETDMKSKVRVTETLSASESKIAEIWRNILQVPVVEAADNFFDLGGHSLQAVQVITQIEKQLGVRIEPALLRYQTLKQLAAGLDGAAAQETQQASLENNHHLSVESFHENEIPIYFGPSTASLFGMYHKPQRRLGDIGVVICPPWGQEYIRSHRACHQLALRLAESGIPTLRFDYLGTGDSDGDDLDFSVKQGVADIDLAIQELRLRTDVSQIALVGLRLGATLAALATGSRSDIAALVLWDPIIDGPAYLQELDDSHRRNLLYYFDNVNAPSEQQLTREYLGFTLSDVVLAELQYIDLLTTTGKLPERVLLVERKSTALSFKLQQHLEGQAMRLQYKQIDGPQLWTENPDKALVPYQTLQAIVGWITED